VTRQLESFDRAPKVTKAKEDAIAAVILEYHLEEEPGFLIRS